MINSINLSDKTYAEILEEAIALVPLFTDEWTNFNASDPGLTVLQNLSAFSLLQRNYINEVNDAVRRRLLGLLGITAGEYRAAHVFLCAAGGDAVTLAPGEKLMAEDLCFEPCEPVSLEAWSVVAAATECGGAYKDITYLLDRGVKSGAAAFGAPAVKGAAFYVFTDGLPEDGRPLLLDVQVLGEEKRNPFCGQDIRFARLRWQFYTKGGWVDAAADDGTKGFLLSGIVRLEIPSPERTMLYKAQNHGYAFRCILEDANYDVSPRIRSVTANVFEVLQKDSKAKSLSFSSGKSVEITDRMAAQGYFTVYGREEADGAYYAYRPHGGFSQEGRFYAMSQEPGVIRLEFDKDRFGYAPEGGDAAVRVVCYDRQMSEHRMLGRVMGCEDQVLDVEQLERVLPENFCVLAEFPGADGTPAYRFIAPGSGEPDDLQYSVLPESGEIRIADPGAYEGCVLYLSDCAVTEGETGNVRPGNRFQPMFPDERDALPEITNPSAGFGGGSRESVEQLRLRFLAQMRQPSVAVTPADYEEIAKATPGLCIHKVKATASPGENLVRIAVKPYTEDEKPVLSPLHTELINRHVDRRRMIGARVELLQPVYVPVDVRAVIYVKRYYKDAGGHIERFLRDALDGVTGDAPFGARLSYHALFRSVETLDCVETLYEFSMAPRAWQHARPDGVDIILNDDALYCPGELSLELK
ncbi:MAG: baseplate J/gp47 family protein [Clostridiales Family XIII bacterium]|nr:baseplate J/gp47 family protein [Clostridiales Family XIII bacterium]